MIISCWNSKNNNFSSFLQKSIVKFVRLASFRMLKESIYLHLNTQRGAKVPKAYCKSRGYTKWSRVKEISRTIVFFCYIFEQKQQKALIHSSIKHKKHRIRHFYKIDQRNISVFGKSLFQRYGKLLKKTIRRTPAATRIAQGSKIHIIKF